MIFYIVKDCSKKEGAIKNQLTFQRQIAFLSKYCLSGTMQNAFLCFFILESLNFLILYSQKWPIFKKKLSWLFGIALHYPPSFYAL